MRVMIRKFNWNTRNVPNIFNPTISNSNVLFQLYRYVSCETEIQNLKMKITCFEFFNLISSLPQLSSIELLLIIINVIKIYNKLKLINKICIIPTSP